MSNGLSYTIRIFRPKNNKYHYCLVRLRNWKISLVLNTFSKNGFVHSSFMKELSETESHKLSNFRKFQKNFFFQIYPSSYDLLSYWKESTLKKNNNTLGHITLFSFYNERMLQFTYITFHWFIDIRQKLFYVVSQTLSKYINFYAIL